MRVELKRDAAPDGATCCLCGHGAGRETSPGDAATPCHLEIHWRRGRGLSDQPKVERVCASCCQTREHLTLMVEGLSTFLGLESTHLQLELLDGCEISPDAAVWVATQMEARPNASSN